MIMLRYLLEKVSFTFLKMSFFSIHGVGFKIAGFCWRRGRWRGGEGLVHPAALINKGRWRGEGVCDYNRLRSDVEINSILFNGNVWLILNDWTEIKNVLLMVCEDDVWTRFLLMRYRQNGVIRACHNSVARLLCRNSLMCFFYI